MLIIKITMIIIKKTLPAPSGVQRGTLPAWRADCSPMPTTDSTPLRVGMSSPE